MVEFNALTGGRYTYADDLENLQELALAFSQLFDDCDNFIVSGCNITNSGTAISAGYVYINGKLRRFAGQTELNSFPYYIYEDNSTESVPYESGKSDVGRNKFGCALGKTVPVGNDPLTGKARQSIAIQAAGGRRMKDAFIGKYALQLSPAASSQTVQGQVTFQSKVTANGGVTSTQPIEVKGGTTTASLAVSGSNVNLIAKTATHSYQFSAIDGTGFKFYIDGTEIVAFKNSAIVFSKPIRSSQGGTIGKVTMRDDDIFQGTAYAFATLNINMSSPGENAYVRDTKIGDGQGNAIFHVVGGGKAVYVYGTQTISNNGGQLTLKSATHAKTNNALTCAVYWKDSNNSIMGKIGFVNTDSQNFSISVPDYNIVIQGLTTVNIGPAIKENGVLLSEKYAQISAMNTALAGKADKSSVYTTTQSDAKYGAKGVGLSQFVSSTATQAQCRSQIGALGADALTPYTKLDQYLADMAKDEASKKKIRDNIGAASTGDFQTKLQDTGWISIKEGLYARQIGNMVCVQGTIKTIHSGTLFNIPNTISPPRYAVKNTIAFSNSKCYVTKLAASSRACSVVYCNGSCGNTTEFSLTYMT